VDHVGHKAGIQAAYLYHDQLYIEKDVYKGNTDIPRRNAGMPSNARTPRTLVVGVCQRFTITYLMQYARHLRMETGWQIRS
jgi:hypothetical protein